MDALQYKHNSVTPTAGTRDFSFVIQDGVLNSNNASFAVNVDCSSLPVTWLYFNGKNNAGSNLLSWATSFELNNAFFEVQSSTDAVSFKTIGKVPAGTNNANEYRFTDAGAANGMTYYRIKQVDADGTFTYSRVVAVNKAETGISFLYSSASGLLQLNNTSGKPLQLLIYDANGRLQMRAQLQTGINRISINHLVQAVYALTVNNGQAPVFSGRLIR